LAGERLCGYFFHLFSLQGAVVLDDALYPPRFLKPDDDLAAEMQLFLKAHRPMARVREEDGRILGLITLEDILEETVGEIEDEHDLLPLKLLLRASRRTTKPAKPTPMPPTGDR
jgi:Mg2+/Co2+ transporter CorB